MIRQIERGVQNGPITKSGVLSLFYFFEIYLRIDKTCVIFLKLLLIFPTRKWLCVKTGIQERGTECGERGEWGECYFPGNVTKHSGEYPQTFRGMSPNIPGNVLKHSRECPQTFRGMTPNIPENVAKHSGECHQTFPGML